MSELITTKVVMQITGFPEATLRRYRKREGFPSPIKIGAHNIMWRAEEIADWINANMPGKVRLHF